MRAPFFWRPLRLGIIPVLMVAPTVLGFACADDKGEGGEGKVQVVTSLPLFADFVQQIGGERVAVQPLLPSGADPHTWEASPRDVEKVAAADIAFANGLDVDEAAVQVLEANLPVDAELVLLGERSLEERRRASRSGLPPYQDDPHLWLHLGYASLYAAEIEESLAGELPDARPEFTSNLSNYLKDLNELEVYLRTRVDTISNENRKLVTAHDAFIYFAAGLGLEVVGFVAHGPGQEASPQDIAEIARVLREEGVPAVFVEPQIGEESRILEQAAEDAGVIACTLYSDSLDDSVSSYIEMMRFNADELSRCLGGEG